MAKAVSTATQKRLSGNTDEIDIYLRGGVYNVTDTIALGTVVSGNWQKPLKISAYNAEDVRISGGADIPLSAMTSADASFTGKIIDTSAASSILKYDLAAAGITDYGEISRRGHSISENKTAQAEISIDDKTMRLAGWPNTDFVGLNGVTSYGTRTTAGITNGCSFTVSYDRPAQWSDPSSAWLSGTLAANYDYDYYPLQSFDAATKTVTLREGAIKDYYSNHFFRFENIPEELDAPGEYYIDRTNGILYLYPPTDSTSSSRITVTMSENDLFRLENASDIVFENIKFDGGRAAAVTGKNNKDITFKGCEVSGFGGNGIRLDSSTDVVIRDSKIHDIGENAVQLTGGDYANIVYSGNEIYNNEIYSFSRLERSYTSGVYIGYRNVGATVSHNHIYDCPHAGIIFYGVNNIFANNEINDAVKEFHDMDAIYVNNSEFPWERGNVIRDNYFHDIGTRTFNGQKQMNISAVRTDNNGNGLTVTGNLFYNIGVANTNAVSGIRAQGTHNTVTHNLFVDCSEAYNSNNTYIEGKSYDMTDTATASLKTQLDSYLPVYGVWFPELSNFFNEHPNSARTNVFSNNIAVNIAFPMSTINGAQNAEGFRGAAELVTSAGNYISVNDPGFVSYSDKDFAFTVDPQTLAAGFPTIKMNTFGTVK